MSRRFEGDSPQISAENELKSRPIGTVTSATAHSEVMVVKGRYRHGADTELREYLRFGLDVDLIRKATAVAVVVIAAASIYMSKTDKPKQAVPRPTPSTTEVPGPETTTTQPADSFRYDYQSSAAVCTVPAARHVVQSGETLYNLAQQSSTVVHDYEMNMLLPAIVDLNTKRHIVSDPDALQIGDEVLTLEKCKIYNWFGDGDGNGFVNIDDLDKQTYAQYEYNSMTNTTGKIIWCHGPLQQCVDLGYIPPTSRRGE